MQKPWPGTVYVSVSNMINFDMQVLGTVTHPGCQYASPCHSHFLARGSEVLDDLITGCSSVMFLKRGTLGRGRAACCGDVIHMFCSALVA